MSPWRRGAPATRIKRKFASPRRLIWSQRSRRPVPVAMQSPLSSAAAAAPVLALLALVLAVAVPEAQACVSYW